jgi:hypothetical protein
MPCFFASAHAQALHSAKMPRDTEPELDAKHEVFRGILFSDATDDEVANLLGMQSMFGTIASLVAGLGVSLGFAVSHDENTVAAEKFDAAGHTYVGAMVRTGAAWSAAVSFTSSMVTIIISMSLYVALSAANIPTDADSLVKLWVKQHYFLLVAELVCLMVAVLFVWSTAYFVGLVKFEVDYLMWAIIGWVGMFLVTFINVYICYLHFYSTMPTIKAHLRMSDTSRAKTLRVATCKA